MYYIDPDLKSASTAPAQWYRDNEILALENKTVFRKTWQLVGRLEQVSESGQYFTTTLADAPIVIVRSEQNQLRGFFNVCRHRAGPVAKGCGVKKLFQCAYHGWLYRLDGELFKAPEMQDAACFEKENFSLQAIHVDSWGPFIFACLEEPPCSLSEYLGNIVTGASALPLDKMRYYRRHDYVIECNWKVYVDNYLEGYHIPVAHPGLMREIDYSQYRVETFRYHSQQYAPIRNPKNELYRRNLDPSQSPEALYYWIYPNLMLNIYPDNIQTNVIIPIGPDKTRTVFEWYFLEASPESLENDFNASFAFSHEVQKEDIEICESVQRGLNSGAYTAGRYSPARENGVHHFHQLLSESFNRF